MFLIDNKNISDPAVNPALEEHCYRSLDSLHDYVVFYINKPSVIVGIHQKLILHLSAPFPPGLLASVMIQSLRSIGAISNLVSDVVSE
jgi:hypothetical protein